MRHYKTLFPCFSGSYISVGESRGSLGGRSSLPCSRAFGSRPRGGCPPSGNSMRISVSGRRDFREFSGQGILVRVFAVRAGLATVFALSRRIPAEDERGPVGCKGFSTLVFRTRPGNRRTLCIQRFALCILEGFYTWTVFWASAVARIPERRPCVRSGRRKL